MIKEEDKKRTNYYYYILVIIIVFLLSSVVSVDMSNYVLYFYRNFLHNHAELLLLILVFVGTFDRF